jgi:hypothetical protein
MTGGGRRRPAAARGGRRRGGGGELILGDRQASGMLGKVQPYMTPSLQKLMV